MSDVTEETPDEGASATSAATPEPPATPEPAAETSTPVAAADDSPAGRAFRKVREGTVVSNKMNQTAIVAVTDRVRHRRYNKTVQRTTKLYVHDDANDLNIGDRVRVTETRPMSKTKRWRLVDVLERAR